VIVQQFFVGGIAHSSYLVAGSSECAIVDPRRDVDIYLEAAEELNMEITHILETHLHADFISGHMDLMDITGADIVAPESANCKFEHQAVAENDEFSIEDMEFRVLETPGHTPEHISYVVSDAARGPDPVGVFCGDTLFVGDVGRPDLFPGRAKELASKLFDSLNDKLLELPEFCEVYPAHGAGSLCGRAMSAKRRSTIGYEREYNSALQIRDRDEFIESLTTNMPGAPDHFSRCSAINREGPALVSSLPEPKGTDARTFDERRESDDTIVLDVRSYDAFGGQHVPSAYHDDLTGNFATFAGWMLPPQSDILLVSSDHDQAKEATVWLRRVGLDKTIGFLDGGMHSWNIAGLPTNHVPQISVREFHEMVKGKREMVLVDVRGHGEYGGHRIEGSVNIPAPDLRTRYKELDPEMTTVLMCSSGRRSSLAASLLKQRGFKDVLNLAGGMTGYSAAGYVPECKFCAMPHGPRFLGKKEIAV